MTEENIVVEEPKVAWSQADAIGQRMAKLQDEMIGCRLRKNLDGWMNSTGAFQNHLSPYLNDTQLASIKPLDVKIIDANDRIIKNSYGSKFNEIAKKDLYNVLHEKEALLLKLHKEVGMGIPQIKE